METLNEVAVASETTTVESVGNVVTMKELNAEGTPRTVDFGKRGKLKKSLDVAVSQNGLRKVTMSVDVCDGSTFRLVYDEENPPKNAAEVFMHGAFQKASDTITKCNTPEDVAFTIEELFAFLASGGWSARAEKEEGVSDIKDLLEALRRAQNYSEAQIPDLRARIMSKLKGDPEKGIAPAPDYVKELKKLPAIKVHLEDIAIEKAQARKAKLGVPASSSSLLSDFAL